MSDEADVANDQVTKNESRSIAYAQMQASKPLPTASNCLWCNTKTKEGRRWCNAECRDMWADFGSQ